MAAHPLTPRIGSPQPIASARSKATGARARAPGTLLPTTSIDGLLLDGLLLHGPDGSSRRRSAQSPEQYITVALLTQTQISPPSRKNLPGPMLAHPEYAPEGAEGVKMKRDGGAGP